MSYVDKYMEFRIRPPAPGRTTPVHEIWNPHRNELAGEIKWYGGFRRYVFYPTDGSGYEPAFLRKVADYIDGLMVARKRI